MAARTASFITGTLRYLVSEDPGISVWPEAPVSLPFSSAASVISDGMDPSAFFSVSAELSLTDSLPAREELSVAARLE